MKLPALLFIVFITKIVFSQVTVLKVKSFRCTASNKSVSPDYKCAARSWSRVESGVSFTFNYTRLCYHTKARFDLKYRETTPFYVSVINTTLNMCEFLNGTDDSFVTKWYIGQFGSSLPKHLLHPCPYFGIFSAANVSLDPSKVLVSKFFQGTYVANIRFFDDIDDNILTMIHESVLMTVYLSKKQRN